jgi:NAD(P)H-hydrate epimerase
MRILTGVQMREADRIAIEVLGIPSLLLMENAGRGVVEGIQRVVPDWRKRRYLIACGRGNNGGDGLVAARHLRLAGVASVDVVLLGTKDQVRGDARWNLEHYEGHYGPVFEIPDEDTWLRWKRDHPAGWDVVVDALFGTGLQKPLTGFPAAWVTEVNEWRAVIRIAVDVPSGLSADTWEVIGPAFRADYTFTMGAPKVCLVFPPACAWAGQWFVVPIGIPPAVLEGASDLIWPDPAELAVWLPPRPLDAHKGQFGRVVVVGGSPGKLGAPYMAGKSALRSGAGLVTVAVPRTLWPSLMGSLDETMTLGVTDTDGHWSASALEELRPLLETADVLIVGPGLGTSPGAQALMDGLLEMWRKPMVVDADGLNVLALHRDWLERLPPMSVLTPHWGEMARLTGESVETIGRERSRLSREFAQRYGVVLVLKGYRTLTAVPDGRVFVNPTGNPGMATAGMGDVLSGFIGGLLGQTRDPVAAAVLGVYLHGRAGDLAARRKGALPLTATDLWETIGEAMKELGIGDGRE